MTTNQKITMVTALQFYHDSGRINEAEYQQLLAAFGKLFPTKGGAS